MENEREREEDWVIEGVVRKGKGSVRQGQPVGTALGSASRTGLKRVTGV